MLDTVPRRRLDLIETVARTARRLAHPRGMAGTPADGAELSTAFPPRIAAARWASFPLTGFSLAFSAGLACSFSGGLGAGAGFS